VSTDSSARRTNQDSPPARASVSHECAVQHCRTNSCQPTKESGEVQAAKRINEQSGSVAQSSSKTWCTLASGHCTGEECPTPLPIKLVDGASRWTIDTPVTSRHVMSGDDPVVHVGTCQHTSNSFPVVEPEDAVNGYVLHCFPWYRGSDGMFHTSHRRGSVQGNPLCFPSRTLPSHHSGDAPESINMDSNDELRLSCHVRVVLQGSWTATTCWGRRSCRDWVGHHVRASGRPGARADSRDWETIGLRPSSGV
jgi:hypothetical protein